MTNHFKDDLSFGEDSEYRFIEAIKHKFHAMYKIGGNFKPYDVVGIKHDGKLVTFEVKHERLYNDTGNVAIEIACNGKPSGLASTKSTYWVVELDDGFWYCDTDKLYNTVFLMGDYDFQVKSGGDGNSAKMALMRGSDFKEFFTKISL